MVDLLPSIITNKANHELLFTLSYTQYSASCWKSMFKRYSSGYSLLISVMLQGQMAKQNLLSREEWIWVNNVMSVEQDLQLTWHSATCATLFSRTMRLKTIHSPRQGICKSQKANPGGPWISRWDLAVDQQLKQHLHKFVDWTHSTGAWLNVQVYMIEWTSYTDLRHWMHRCVVGCTSLQLNVFFMESYGGSNIKTAVKRDCWWSCEKWQGVFLRFKCTSTVYPNMMQCASLWPN